jgi:4-amino-4-deoxy-L-arabinose transferase-like glycosyltransferase
MNTPIESSATSGTVRSELGLLLAVSLGTLAFHLLVNAFGGYGIFRDEFYYIACSHRLAAGYVDQPPLSIFLLAASRSLFGVSQFGLRILPSLAHAGVVFCAGLLALRLGGRKTAAALACFAAALAPIMMGHPAIFQMNAFAQLFWALAVLLVVGIVERSRPGLWILLGIVLGFGLLNKIDFLWFGAGLALALVLTPLRKHLLTPWPYVAAGIALLLFSPYVLWNVTHDFAHLEFIRNASAGKYSGLTPLRFLSEQVILMNPVNLAVCLSGLAFLFFSRNGRRFRVLGIIFLTALAVLLINGHSKAEYLAPAYIMLLAAGGVAVERFSSRPKLGGFAPAVGGLTALVSLVILPFAVPVLPVEAFIRYEGVLGVKASSSEGLQLTELPQHYADMFGWEGLAKDISAVYESLPAEEKAATVVLARNYGEAGALEYFARRYPVPPVISTHNNYWIWGFPPGEIRTIIVIGGNEEDHRRACDVVIKAAVHTCRYCMSYENNRPIFICRGLKGTLADLWKREKGFG